MIVRTRMMLQCPHCGESKLINVTIVDDVAGPAICDSCVAQAIVKRRLEKLAETAGHPSRRDSDGGDTAADVEAA